jgi:hypothetical protein
MSKIDYLEKELSRLLGWIQVADSRMALVLPISTAMLGAIAVLSPTVDLWTAKPAITCSFAAFFLVLSLIFSAFASFPRVEGPKGSVIFFGGIVAREIDQFRQSVNALNESSYQDDLINQCHINSQIANKKFTWVRRAMISLFLSFLPWAISVFLLYGIKS